MKTTPLPFFIIPTLPIFPRPNSHLRPHRTPTSQQTLNNAPTKSPTPTKPISKPIQAPRRPTASPQLTATGDDLESTSVQTLLLAAFGLAALAAPPVLAASAVGPSELLADLAAALAAYIFADFAIGVYHHAVDNYGSERTPIFGFQIAAFQGHHKYPWTITARSLANNLYRLTLPTLPQLLLLELTGQSGPLAAFYITFLVSIVLSQEAHRQAHMIRPAAWALALQKSGLFVGRAMHAAHHRDAFADSYCILSGVCNPVLDHIRFFRVIEAVLFRAFGVEPVCWQLDPDLKKEALAKLSGWRR